MESMRRPYRQSSRQVRGSLADRRRRRQRANWKGFLAMTPGSMTDGERHDQPTRRVRSERPGQAQAGAGIAGPRRSMVAVAGAQGAGGISRSCRRGRRRAPVARAHRGARPRGRGCARLCRRRPTKIARGVDDGPVAVTQAVEDIAAPLVDVSEDIVSPTQQQPVSQLTPCSGVL